MMQQVVGEDYVLVSAQLSRGELLWGEEPFGNEPRRAPLPVVLQTTRRPVIWMAVGLKRCEACGSVIDPQARTCRCR